MGVICQILINKKPEGIHRPGEAVTGTIKFAVDKKTEYSKVTLSLLGTGKCEWTERNGKTSTTYYGFEEFVTIHTNLLKTQEALEVGAYEYPFEFILPNDLPSTFHDEICKIAYKIQIKFEKPNLFSFNKIFSTEIFVRGFVNPTAEGPVIFGLDKTLTKIFSSSKNTIKLKSEINKAFCRPGENMHLTSTVINDTNLATLVKAEIYCFTKYTSNSGFTNIMYKKVKNTRSDIIEVPAQGEAVISQIVPSNFTMYSFITKVMLKEYRVRITIKLPLPYINAFVEMPVLVGERGGMHLESAKKEEESGASASSVTREEDAPPSYWEVMNEDKDTKLK